MGFSKQAAAIACRSIEPPLPTAELVSLTCFIERMDEKQLTDSLMQETDNAESIVMYLRQKSAAASGGNGNGSGEGSVLRVADKRYQDFWRELGSVEIVDNCIQLPEGIHWFGLKAFASLVVVRECYKDLREAIQTHLEASGGVGVTGTPGIGKTLGLGGYIMWNERKKSRQVLYHRLGGPVFLFTFEGVDNTPIVYGAKSEFAFNARQDPKTLYIADGVQPFEDCAAQVILISSPDPAVMRKFCGAQHAILYMDIWSRHELDLLRGHYKLEDEEYKQMIKWYGHVPRWCLEQTKNLPKVQWHQAMDNAIASKDSMRALMSHKQQDANARGVSHVVAHIRTDSMYNIHYQISTSYVASKLMEDALRSKETKFFAMMNSMAKIKGWTHVFGELYQLYFIKMFGTGGTFTYRHVPGRQNVELPSSGLISIDKFTLPTTEALEFDNLRSVKEFQNATLYFQEQGADKKLPAADAILTPSHVDQPAFLIQVTGGKRKEKLSAMGVQAVKDFLKAGWGEVSLIIMYVVPTWTFDEFNADPTTNPEDALEVLPRMIVEFPVNMSDLCNYSSPEHTPDSSPKGRKRQKQQVDGVEQA